MRRAFCQSSRYSALLGVFSLTLSSIPAAAQNRPITADPHPVKGAVQQPFKDLGIVKDKVPEPLKQADKTPYDLTAQNDCAAIEAEITQFDKLLGADVDSPDEDTGARKVKPGKLVGDAIGKTIGLPFRSVLRVLSGAEKNDQKKREAIEAGMARRAYLKGVAHGQGCGMPKPPQIAAQTPEAAPANSVAPEAPPVIPRPVETLAETAPPLIPAPR
jgi:hypothetical protein